MRYRFGAVALLLIMFALLVTTLPVTAPTADEPMYMVRGYAFVSRGKDSLPGCSPCSPVLSSSLSGLFLLLEPQLNPLPPDDDPIWQDNGGTGVFEQFVWSGHAPAQRIIYLTRLPIIFVTLLLGALIFRWAAQRSSPVGAWGALALYVFCPNILAHGRLVTADVVTAATFTLSAYLFDTALRRASVKWSILSGVALGLALASKVSAAALPVAFVIWAIIYSWPRRRDRSAWRTVPVTIAFTLVIGGLTLWGIYRFSIGPIAPGSPSVPAPAYWADWQAVIKEQSAPLPAYLFGEVSTRGWWYYYPITFLVKTPLPVLVLAGLMAIRMLRMQRWSNDLLLLIVPAGIFGGLLTSTHDLGYRYMLPVLPFIFVGSADVISSAMRRRWSAIVIVGLLIWQAIGTLHIYPYYLAYFNEVAGGPEGGRFILADSNLDWGQDLPGLKTYVDQKQISDLQFSYFGGIDPAVYGLHTYALPPVRAAMHAQGAWWLQRYYPPDPAPGVYAISASNLMGSSWIDQNTFAAFRKIEADAEIGHSIFVYAIPARGSPIDLSLSGLQIDQIDPNTYALFKTNDVRPRWFDAASSLIAAPDRSWIALSADRPIAPELAALLADVDPVAQAKTVDDQRAYALYDFDLSQRILAAAQHSEQAARDLSLPVKFGDTAELIGYHVSLTGEDLTLVTYWRAGDSIVTPLQLFVHVLGPDGSIVAQDDRLDASAFGWRPGDVIVQLHHLTLAKRSDLSQDYTVEIGLYNPDSGERLPVVVNNHEIDRRLILAQFAWK
jgi:Dolichyl-phosphate-mannose-protein mannosyltransferase